MFQVFPGAPGRGSVLFQAFPRPSPECSPGRFRPNFRACSPGAAHDKYIHYLFTNPLREVLCLLDRGRENFVITLSAQGTAYAERTARHLSRTLWHRTGQKSDAQGVGMVRSENGCDLAGSRCRLLPGHHRECTAFHSPPGGEGGPGRPLGTLLRTDMLTYTGRSPRACAPA